MSDTRDFLDFMNESDGAIPKIGDLIDVPCGQHDGQAHHLIVTAVVDMGEQVRIYYILDPSDTRRG